MGSGESACVETAPLLLPSESALAEATPQFLAAASSGGESALVVATSPFECGGEAAQSVYVLIKGFGQGGVAIALGKTYNEVPDIIALEEQAEKALIKSYEDDPHGFDGTFELFVDDEKLGNRNIKPLLISTVRHSGRQRRVLVKMRRTFGSSPSSRSAGSVSFGGQACPRAVNFTCKPGLLVCIDGTIGCGKSTLMKNLQAIQSGRHPRILFKPEPIEDWWHLLVRLYEVLKVPGEPAGQHLAVKSLEDAIWRHHNSVLDLCRQGFYVIAERGLQAQVRVFCHVLKSRDMLSQPDFDNFVKHYKTLRDAVPTVAVYFRLSHEVVLPRIKKRAKDEQRGFEESITLDYLKQLGDRYDIIYGTRDSEGVIVVDANNPPEDLATAVAIRLQEEVDRILHKQAEEGVRELMEVFKDCRPPLA